MTKEDDEGFENSTKCLNCDHAYVEGDVKKINHFISLENIEVMHPKIVISRLN